jgi:hypothetical protein
VVTEVAVQVGAVWLVPQSFKVAGTAIAGMLSFESTVMVCKVSR